MHTRGTGYTFNIQFDASGCPTSAAIAPEDKNCRWYKLYRDECVEAAPGQHVIFQGKAASPGKPLPAWAVYFDPSHPHKADTKTGQVRIEIDDGAPGNQKDYYFNVTSEDCPKRPLDPRVILP